MLKKYTAYLITLIIILIVNSGLYAQVSELYLGEEDLWKNSQLTNLVFVDGKRGFLDITNADNEYQLDKFTDMILPLNDSTTHDKTGNYSILNRISYLESENTLGGGAAFFDGAEPLTIEAGHGAMFSPSTIWGDFSLEFRMLPATLKEGSTVFLWKGLQMKDDFLIPQEIRCTITNRRLVWDFENFFLNPDNSIDRISLSGDKLIPGTWSHHMITFDSGTGLLEYKINNIPADNTYTSKTGNESKEFNIPIIGNQQSFPIELGENYSGLIDEFRISKKVIDNPVLNKFSPSGYLETTLIDLMIPDSELIKIETESFLPENTAMHFQYAMSNNKFDLLRPDTTWIDFEPSTQLNHKGRYLKIKSQFYSEIATESAPVLSNFKIIYHEADAPFPPVNLSIKREDGKIILSWERSINPEIKGYLIYYGEEPGQYFTEGSPIDSGLKNSIILENMEGKRYYFAVTSYKSLTPRLESIFSSEISINP